MPGALLVNFDSYAHFKEADRMRWLETGFQSWNPADSAFLAPDAASEPFLREGWPLLGYRTAQDQDPGVGALPRKKRPSPLRVTPLAPVLMEAGNLVLRFAIADPLAPAASGPSGFAVAYLGLVQGIPDYANAFGGHSDILLRTEPQYPTIPSASLRLGYNELRIPAAGLKLDSVGAGFMEMAVKGPDAFGNIATFPLLPGFDSLRVELLDESEDKSITGILKGGSLRVRVTRQQSPADTTQTTRIALFSSSGSTLEFPDNPERDSSGFFSARPAFTVKIRLNEIPEGGSELLCATEAPQSTRLLAGFGVSKPLAISASPLALHARPDRVPIKPEVPRKIRNRNLLGRKQLRTLEQGK